MGQPPNGISIGSAIFEQLICMPHTQTNRHTDTQITLRVTAVAIGHICALQGLKRNNGSPAKMQYRYLQFVLRQSCR